MINIRRRKWKIENNQMENISKIIHMRELERQEDLKQLMNYIEHHNHC
mgnify:CR=1 FL=1